MKYLICIMMLLLVLVVPVLAQTTDTGPVITPQSTGVALTETGYRFTYVFDRKDYGVAIGKSLWDGNRTGVNGVHFDAMTIVKPNDDVQLAAGFALGYDIRPLKTSNLIFSPLIGILTDITDGYDGKSTVPFVGFSITTIY